MRFDLAGQGEIALRASGLCKAFGGAQALREVDLEIGRGEIHGLVGENGSGKSTLIKILAGYHAPDAGQLEVGGKEVDLPLSPGAPRELGLEFVHQDLGLIESLSVTENLRLGQIATSTNRWHISWRSERRASRELFSQYGLTLDPAAPVRDLEPVEKAMLAILRAIEGVQQRLGGSGGSGDGVLVLDEPTVFLPRAGIDELFGLLRGIVSAGVSVLFVSHHLDEVREITDRVTVLRDGRRIGTADTATLSDARLVEMIIGRELAKRGMRRPEAESRAVVATIDGCTGRTVRNLSLTVHAGEIIGVTGLVGSGFEEIPQLLFGARDIAAGTLRMGGRPLNLSSLTPSKALGAGTALVPADRQRDASLPSLPITDNITIPVLDRFVKGLRLRRRRLENGARAMMERFDVRPPDPRPLYSSLSGGNQQKVVLAKWLETDPRLLLLHEPTQGVDVGARDQIFQLVRDAAAEGMAVVCASADHEQLAAIAHRVLVIARGEVTAELVGDEITTDRIAELCYQSIDLHDQGASEQFDLGTQDHAPTRGADDGIRRNGPERT